MIRISKIDDKLSIYRCNRVYIWGAGKNGKYIANALSCFGIKICAFIDNSLKKQKTMLKGCSVISPEELYRKKSKDNNILVQIGLNRQNEKEVVPYLEERGVEYILYDEAYRRLTHLQERSLLNSSQLFMKKMTEKLDLFVWMDEHGSYTYTVNNLKEEMLFLCMPQKTGNYTLLEAFIESGIQVHNFWHHANSFNKKFFSSLPDKKIKIITAVREPISQNISALYQNFKSNDAELLLRRREYWEDGGDVQTLFDVWLQSLNYMDYGKERMTDGFDKEYVRHGGTMGRLIQQFIPEFQDNVMDIMQYDFDREAGWSVMAEGNIEVFVFQLEKLSEVYPCLFRWAGCGAEDLRSNNVMEDTWLQTSYEQAKKEIVFPREYFDKCYSEPYVRHFYNEKDIERFKDRWKSHISDAGTEMYL